MTGNPPRAAVLWTGGKDSAFAMHEAMTRGYSVASLATFAPPGARFLAHPLKLMAAQAEALRLPHRVMEIVEPFEAGYRQAISQLCRSEGLSAIVTGDIAEVAGMPNWVRQCCRGLDVEVFMPLWHRARGEIMDAVLAAGIKPVLSCVKRPWFTADWLGRVIGGPCLEELRRLGQRTGLDLCGENGEYHTMVMDGPEFRESLEIAGAAPREEGDIMYLEVQQVRRLGKPG